MRFFTVLLLIVFQLSSASADQTQAGFKYGERPKNSIFDPSGVLTIKEQAQIAEPLAAVLANEGIDVIVVILPEIGDAPPVHVAQGFARKWNITDVNAVVLHVPGQPDTPWIFPGNVMTSLIHTEILADFIASAKKRAAAEPSDYDKVRAASIEASDALRHWIGGSSIQSEANIRSNQTANIASERRKSLLKITAAVGAASLIPLIFGVAFIVFRFSNKRPKSFPLIRVSQRLGAPYAGGNNAVHKITYPPHETPTPRSPALLAHPGVL